MTSIRTRFAPSPTGFLHVGGLRTALYCYLLAKKNNGSFLLRIEDTDQARSVEGGIENIIRTLSWAGLPFDEGPGKPGVCKSYIQSERLSLYKQHAEQLVEEGNAYYCFCSPERLDQVRQQQIAAHLPPAYDRHCRDLGKDEVARRLAAGERHVIRMKVPLDGEITFADIIRGQVTIAYKVVDDQVIIKSDGFPTYHLAVVVDDHFMQISHVIRGEEWLPSTPKHLLLYRYFGWQAPVFAHLPLLLNPDHSKLSKRQGDVAVEDYRAKGYLPEALINFISLLGWNPGGTRELFSLEELIKEFSLERVGHAGAVFNIEKLQWFNQQYIMKLPADRLLTFVRPLLDEKGWGTFEDDYVKKVIELMRDRAVTTLDFVALTEFCFKAPTTFDEKTKAKCWNADAITHVKRLAEQLDLLEPLTAATAEKMVHQYAEEQKLGMGKVMLPLRLALTGVAQGPSMFHLMEVLSKEETLKRLAYAVEHCV